MDTLTIAARSIRMSRIPSKDTKPELLVRSLLHRLGYRYRLHRRDLAGSPDIVFPSRAKVIFVHGCFWHAHKNCRLANRPKSHRRFWYEKFMRNISRDKASQRRLRRTGWGVCVVWECETRNITLLESELSEFLGVPGNNNLGRK